MTQNTTPRFYKLCWDFTRRDGYEEAELPDYDIWMTKYPEKDEHEIDEWNSPYRFFKPGVLDIPKGVEFMGNWDFLQINDPTYKRVTDFPDVKEGWPIMSKRMLRTLLSVGAFPHQIIPITIESDEWGSEETTNEFVAVQLTEHLENVLDLDNSVYEEDEYRGNIFDIMALKEPEGGFPALFRVKEKPTRLYVSSAAKLALEKAGIKEIQFSTYQLASV